MILTEDTVSDEEFGQHIFDDFFVKIFDCIIETKNQLYLIDWKLSIDPEICLNLMCCNLDCIMSY